MKNTKIVTCLSALVLLFGVAACSESEETTTGGNSGNSSTSSTDGVTSPMDYINLANSTGNYSLFMEVDEWVSDPVLASNVNSGNVDYDELFDTMVLESNIISAYYTDDALYIEYYYILNDNYYFDTGILFVNTTNRLSSSLYEYYSYDGTNWYLYDTYAGYTWQDVCWSLFDNSYYFGLTSSSFTQVGSSVYEDSTVYSYYFQNDTALQYFAYMCGIDLWSSYLLGYITMYAFDYIYVYPSYNEMDAFYYCSYWAAESSSSNYYELVEDDFYIGLYDFGETDISSTVSYIEGVAKQSLIYY